MNRQEHLAFCRKCQNRKSDLRQGLLCGLTGKIADFEESCENFKVDETVPERTGSEVPEQIPVPGNVAAKVIREEDLNRLKHYQNFYHAVIGGTLAMLVSAIIWAVITVATEYQIGYMAIGVGLLVGFSVRFFGAGIDRKFGFLGAGLSLLGCLLGNLFSQVGFIADSESLGYIETLKYFNLSLIGQVFAETFNPIDLLFYGIAIYEGYKFSFRNITADLLARLGDEGFDPAPKGQAARVPLFIISAVVIGGLVFTLGRGKSGEHREYYDSGKLLVEGEYRNGKEHGLWTYYYENGNVQVIAELNKGNLNGKWELYDENGVLTQKGQYVNGLEHGVWISYSNGIMKDSGLYENSRMTGLWKMWHPNGLLAGMGYYRMNFPDSIWQYYYENGMLQSEGKLVLGLRSGLWKDYYETGAPRDEIIFLEGEEETIQNCWSKDGNLIVSDGNGFFPENPGSGFAYSTGEVINGRKSGKWLTYDTNSKLREEGLYADSLYRIINTWDENGQQGVINGNGQYSGIKVIGTICESGEIRDGLREGTWNFRQVPSDLLILAEDYLQGRENGRYVAYTEDGEVSCEGELINGEKTGLWTWYNSSGGISSTVNYVDGKKDGKQEIWSLTGYKCREETYRNGVLVKEKNL